MAWITRMTIWGEDSLRTDGIYDATAYDWRGKEILNAPIVFTVEPVGCATINTKDVPSSGVVSKTGAQILLTLVKSVPQITLKARYIYTRLTASKTITIRTDAVTPVSAVSATIPIVSSTPTTSSVPIASSVPIVSATVPVVSAVSSTTWYDVKNHAVGDGVTDDTENIRTAQIKAISLNLPLYFPTGKYLIKPNKLTIDTKWLGCGTIVTKETIPYNVMLTINKSGVGCEGLTFDQMGDTDMLPNSGAYQGCHILHITTANNVQIKNCKFVGYGVTSLLLQPPQGYGQNMVIENNIGRWTRRTNLYYDATIFNLDGESGIVDYNDVQSIRRSDIVNWKAETGIEVHFTKSECYRNRVEDCINGILPVGYPMLYNIYDPTLHGNINIYDNTLINVSRGIPCWGAHTIDNEFKNADIHHNKIVLKLERMSPDSANQLYYPCMGVGLQDGGRDKNYFRNIKIRNNEISTVVETGLNAQTLLDYGLFTGTCAAISLYTNNTCEGIIIADNVINYPYPTFDIRSKNGQIHKAITITGNKMTDCAIYHVYDPQRDVAGHTVYEGVYNIRDATAVNVSGNEITGKQPLPSHL